ncbi:MAG: D-2-hydroxyacid dehydrogenase [Phycisphaeraceae bacterium]
MPHSIVILDGYTLNPGDLDWQPLRQLQGIHSLTIHDRTPDDQIVPRTRSHAIALTNKTPLRKTHLDQLPDLKYIGVLATGTNIIDLATARDRRVTVTNVPGYSTDSVAQHTIALLLELASQVGAHDQAVQRGDWAAGPDFSFTVAPLIELSGKTLGIVGMGSIGKRVATIAAALGMRIVAAQQRSMADVSLPGIDIQWLPHDELFAQADAVTLHCPLTEQTQGIVNAQRLASMKRTAYLINTGRGQLIDEAALADALHAGRIAGAGLDVLSVEPPAKRADTARLASPLIGAPRCIITPHIAWATLQARRRLMSLAVDNVRAFLAGQPTHVVN